ncbi:hypothetical protein ACNKHT_11455 [Shigella flexneri]
MADDTILDLMPRPNRCSSRPGAQPGTSGDPRYVANPDTYFQSREATNRWYHVVYDHVEQAMNDFSAATGRQYQPLILRASASGTGDYPDGLCHWHL